MAKLVSVKVRRSLNQNRGRSESWMLLQIHWMQHGFILSPMSWLTSEFVLFKCVFVRVNWSYLHFSFVISDSLCCV